jgi:hypothetical protein
MCLNRQKCLKNSDFHFNSIHFSYNSNEASAAAAAASKASDSPADDSDRNCHDIFQTWVGGWQLLPVAQSWAE